MKLLTNSVFEALSEELSCAFGGRRIDGRLESYSCKMSGCDKKLYKSLVHSCGSAGAANGNESADVLVPLSPSQSVFSYSPTKACAASAEDGAEEILCNATSLKTLSYLISALNASFPDYDFSESRSSEFSAESGYKWVVTCIDSQLGSVAKDYDTLKQRLWQAVDDEIGLQECETYSYNPDLTSDPFGEDGAIWSFNYFFYNKNRKRIVFFACRCKSDWDDDSGSDDGVGMDQSFLSEAAFDVSVDSMAGARQVEEIAVDED